MELSTMVTKKLATGAGLLVALMITAGFATAQPLALVTGDGGGQASGEAEGAYHADASGATEAAIAHQENLSQEAKGTYEETTDTYLEARNQAHGEVNNTTVPDRPQCECADKVAGQLGQAGQAEAQHTDQVHKAAELESEYVDAGADLSAAAQAEAWFKDAFEGAGDALRSIEDMLSFETEAAEDATGNTDAVIDAEQQVRAQVDSALDQDVEMPNPDPSLSGEVGAQHATDATSQAAGQGQAQLP